MLTLAVLLSTLFVGAFSVCPYGFTLHGGSCYLVVGLNSTWIEAKKYCDVVGGDLAVVESAEEETYLVNILKQIDTAGTIFPENYWLDGTDVVKEGEFRWMGKNGNSIPISGYTNWSPGQPDNAGRTENCLEIRFSFSILWNDLDCNTKQNFICEAR
ncbi:perlucin-like [Mizuhopecten yessoensis]|uniref:perlucin-like n=1 Tax=Mizuhopecten yessoensis TaxID=6573 RepID=UPI000B45B5EC|nr:perlucin-like [Mizuhopecten yessoensis]